MHSKNYERYLEWFKKGSVSESQLERLTKVGLITEEEKEEILHWNDPVEEVQIEEE